MRSSAVFCPLVERPSCSILLNRSPLTGLITSVTACWWDVPAYPKSLTLQSLVVSMRPCNPLDFHVPENAQELLAVSTYTGRLRDLAIGRDPHVATASQFLFCVRHDGHERPHGNPPVSLSGLVLIKTSNLGQFTAIFPGSSCQSPLGVGGGYWRAAPWIPVGLCWFNVFMGFCQTR